MKPILAFGFPGVGEGFIIIALLLLVLVPLSRLMYHKTKPWPDKLLWALLIILLPPFGGLVYLYSKGRWQVIN